MPEAPVTTARTWTEMADAVHRRFPGAAADAVAAAIEAAGLTQSGLARIVNRLQEPAGAEWPKVAMTGEVAYLLAAALHEAGILDRVPPCTHCGRPRMVNSRGLSPPTCGACGSRNADGTKGRNADPGKSMCPAGVHRALAYTLRCDACADEADTALIQDAILQVGARAVLARTVISDVLLSRMSRRRVAEWLRAGRSLDQDDAPPPLVQRLRHALAARAAERLPGPLRWLRKRAPGPSPSEGERPYLRELLPQDTGKTRDLSVLPEGAQRRLARR